MVAGHLREKKGIYYVVLNYKDENGKRRTPSFSTKLPVKGNKKRAEEMLRKAQQDKTEELECRKLMKSSNLPASADSITFTGFLDDWLKMMQTA